jgi:hypothetical protein
MNKLFESREWRLWDLGRPIANGKPYDFPRRFRLERKLAGGWTTVKGGIDRSELMEFLEDLGTFLLRLEGYQ